ncbi:exodeoxyribonuclease VII large subunit [Corynebacterium liangguodongii]|uniref:Exodeoxyribonuclease 7 large subunit n=1 Tax=Corynebacterium liangguodongii TaxID=2079535 RepID=A0A2S0WDA3_9CORY|nr:exodeoxyribonuclease VII large subunit [Corynebacterium liangguodongii]AWB83741.1 exodeoxyribonuclease VII large subunit [Corynebacterium liangguodongii]PWB99449.1 exodeoxyribonuclease VII large subunit [Corynebacterium liangguodongii]
MTKPKSTPENPWPVSKLNSSVKQWIERLGWLWVEGQLTQVGVKPSWRMSYLTLRDTQEQASVELTAETSLIRSMPTPLKEGDRVVVLGKPAFYPGRGRFSMYVTDIRHVGEGELLARIEQLRKKLAAEGLCDPARKRPLPYLPRTIGLITGKGSAAERDVMSVAQSRWPAVSFTVINTPVQGATAVPAIVEALGRLDADDEVDVIIIARGGGSVEDLLPFSEEALQRAVAAARTPVVSAIGHEPDNPVLDNVADLRAATPTDAAKRVVPDAAQERAFIAEARARTSAALRGWVERERSSLRAVRSRPALANPMATLEQRRDELDRARSLIRRDITYLVREESSRVAALRSQVAALGPAATLARGYAVVQVVPRDGSEAQVVTSIEQAPPGSQLRMRVADGSVTAASIATHQAD